MGKILRIISLLILAGFRSFGQSDANCQWWIDNDLSSLKTGTLNGGMFNMSSDVGVLESGTHYLNFRISNEKGWGSIYRKMFFKIPLVKNNVVSYEYWFDCNYEDRVAGQMTPNALTLNPDVSGLKSGMHFFNVRLCNDRNEKGSVYRSAFFISNIKNIANVSFEYWIDNDYAGKTSGNFTEGENIYAIELDNLSDGLHRFSYRVRNSEGVWGSVFVKHFFHKKQTPGFASYEYWIDNDYNNRVVQASSSRNLTFDVNLSKDLKEGLHYFNFRGCNVDGVYGSTYRKLFYLHDKDKGGRIIGYRHSINETDLGYVKLDHQPSGIYTFDVNLPDGVGIDIADVPIHFNGDVLSISHRDSVSYRIQIKSDRGWTSPSSYSFEAGVNYSVEAEYMSIPSSLTFARPNGGQFKAVKFESVGNPLYATLDRRATMDIYQNSTKVCSVSPEELLETKMLNLQSGTYYGVIYNVEANNSSDDVRLSISDTNLENIAIDYDGRFASLSSSEEGVSIYYTLDGSSPNSGILYEKPFDVGGLNQILAIAKKGTDSTSGISTYPVKVYADEEHVETSATGMLSSAFNWDVNFPLEVENYTVSGPLNDEDFGTLRTMSSLKHLDMSSVEIETIPNKAFSDMSLISVVLPDKMKGYGEDIFSGCHSLSAIECYALNINIDNNLIASADNPNLILYLSDRVSVSVDQSMIHNVIKGQFANYLRIFHGYPFFAPKDFIAREATFTRNFSKSTGYDFSAGWETIALPFDVQTIKDENSEIYPFAAESAGDRRFWLYSPSADGWLRSSSILAYQPFLIAMPNNHWYADDMIITGDVSFQSKNVEICASPESEGYEFKNGMLMYSNFLPVSSGNDFYTINNDSFEEYAPGSVFVRDLRDVVPFECYLTAAGQQKIIPVMDSSDVQTITDDCNIKVWTEHGDVYIYSAHNSRVRIFDTVGNLVRIADVKAGEVCRISDLYKGIYIIGSQKVYVK